MFIKEDIPYITIYLYESLIKAIKEDPIEHNKGRTTITSPRTYRLLCKQDENATLSLICSGKGAKYIVK